MRKPAESGAPIAAKEGHYFEPPYQKPGAPPSDAIQTCQRVTARFGIFTRMLCSKPESDEVHKGPFRQPGERPTSHNFYPAWDQDDLICSTNWRFSDGEWRVCEKPVWDGAHWRPLPPPSVGRDYRCWLCSQVKPWGTFDTMTGAIICTDCRDAAYDRMRAARS